MNHPYLRAYMAGIVVPTAFLLVGMTAFTLARFVFEVPVPIERVVVFPMALIPNLFGVWNMLYVGLRSRSRTVDRRAWCTAAVCPHPLGPHAGQPAWRDPDRPGRSACLPSGQAAVRQGHLRVARCRRRVLPRVEVHRRVPK